MAAESVGSHLESLVRRAGELLSSLGRRWALVGGLAVSARAEPRFTRDADLAVAVADDSDAETLILELRRAGYRTLAVLEQEGFLAQPHDGFVNLLRNLGHHFFNSRRVNPPVQQPRSGCTDPDPLPLK